MRTAKSLGDIQQSIPLDVLRTMLNPVIDSAEHTLVLINACNSGAFLDRKSFGVNSLGINGKSAHAILASRKYQSSFHENSVGPGSVFFEEVLAGLKGAADRAPKDGVVTYRELDDYLHDTIPRLTDSNQSPVEGDIARKVSEGEFYFLNRKRPVNVARLSAWSKKAAVNFGEQTERPIGDRTPTSSSPSGPGIDEVRDAQLPVPQGHNCTIIPYPVFNPFPITSLQRAGINCTDFAVVSVRNVAHLGEGYAQEGTFRAGDSLFVDIYVHNGAAQGLDSRQTTMRNVRVAVTVNLESSESHAIDVILSADNAVAKHGSALVKTPDRAMLEVVAGSGEVSNSRGEALSRGATVGNNVFYLGDLPACFSFSKQIRFRVNAVGTNVASHLWPRDQ